MNVNRLIGRFSIPRHDALHHEHRTYPEGTASRRCRIGEDHANAGPAVIRTLLDTAW
ncbi:MAG TPA: hypothetical protein VNW89_10495 [Stellaceae bacterium]|jgi:hypothetical protein|nr:hypothetical protein [Stellaceae bacterium]